MENAVSAGCRDPRFSPVREEELDRLVYSVDVLGETEEIASPEELDVKEYGVIVSKEMCIRDSRHCIRLQEPDERRRFEFPRGDCHI